MGRKIKPWEADVAKTPGKAVSKECCELELARNTSFTVLKDAQLT